MDILTEPIRRRFEEQMLEHLRSAFAAQIAGVSEEDLRAVIRQTITKAATYHITAAPDVARYLEYVVCFGPNFYDAPELAWAAEILQSESLNGTQKMDLIDEREQHGSGASSLQGR